MRKERFYYTVFFSFVLLLLTGLSLDKALSAIGIAPDLFVMKSFYDIRGARLPPDDIIIVSIDDESLDKLKLSTKRPFSQKNLADGLDLLLQGAPKKLLIDSALFTEEGEASDYQRLSDFLKDMRVIVYHEIVEDLDLKSSLIVDSDSKSENKNFENLFKEGSNYLRSPLEILGGQVYQISSKQSLDALINISDALGIKNNYINGRFFLDFYGSQRTIKRIPFKDLFRQDSSNSLIDLKDKILILGLEAVSYRRGHIESNQFFIPSALNRVFSPEIQATKIANLINQGFVKVLSINVFRSALIIVSLLAAYALTFSSFKKSSLVLLGIALLIFTTSYIFLIKQHIWLPQISILLSIPIISAVIKAALAVLSLGAEAQKTKKSFYID